MTGRIAGHDLYWAPRGSADDIPHAIGRTVVIGAWMVC